MTVYIIRETMLGELLLVEKRYGKAPKPSFPTPMLGVRFETIQSPIDDRPITSWRERDRDMRDNNAVDPSDLPRAPFEKREREHARRRELDRSAVTEWTDPT